MYANPEEILDLDDVVLQLKPYLTYDKQELTNLLKKRNIRYISIINKLNILLSDEIKQYILDELDAIKK